MSHSEDDNTGECMYPGTFLVKDSTTIPPEEHPHSLSLLLILTYIEAQVGMDATDTRMHQRKLFKKKKKRGEKGAEELKTLKIQDPLTIFNFKRQLDELKQKAVSTHNRDQAQGYNTNEFVQEKLSNLMKVTCHRTERKSSKDQMQKAANLIC